MKTIKRTIFAVLAVMTAVASAVSVSAETVTGNNQKRDIDVKAKYSDGAATPEVYSVDVVWGEMEFTYSASGTRVWNPATHKYDDNITTGWTAKGNTVTVTNHSNKAVDAKFDYTKAAGFDGVNGGFDVSSKTLAAGVENDYVGADHVSAALTLNGSLPSNVNDFVTVGSVTVSIN